MDENNVIKFTSPATWSEIRVLYESGEYPNLKTLYEKHKGNYEDMPELYLITQRAACECWDKERYTEIKTEAKRRNMVELYAKLGMDDETQAKYRIECVKAVDEIKDVIKLLYQSLNNLDPNCKDYTQALSKIKVLSDTMFKGMNTSLAALQDISKLTGDYAPVSTKEMKGHGFKTKDGMKSIEEMTEEEILQDLKRMQRAGIDLTSIEDFNSSSDAQGAANEP